MTEITLYQAEWCPYSHRVRHLLTTHGVSYRLVNVEPDRSERNELEAATGTRAIPTLVVDGTVLEEWGEIGQWVTAHYPVARELLGGHERHAAPAAAARLDSGDVDDLARMLQDAFAQYGFALVDDPVAAPGSARTLALVHDELNERLAEIEPRLRPALPLRISLHRHDNGAVALTQLPNQLWMHFHNAELNKQAYQLTERIRGVFEHVGTKSGVA